MIKKTSEVKVGKVRKVRKVGKVRKVIRNVLKEYISRDEIYLKDYFSQTEEAKKYYLPHEYYYFFEDFLMEEGIDFEVPKEMVSGDDGVEEMELMVWLEANNKNLYNSFANYLYKKINENTLPIPDSEYPAWSYFDGGPKIIKNQWLIHFTDNANEIASKGFKYGVDDITKLGLTTHLGEFDKKYGGYNFAYTISDFPRYAKSGFRNKGYKYGNEAVLFKASGIKLWHYGDEEPQVIFYGNTATNIIPILGGEKFDWGVYAKNGRLLYENDDLLKVVEWISKNYNQYRKSIHETFSISNEKKDILDDVTDEKIGEETIQKFNYRDSLGGSAFGRILNNNGNKEAHIIGMNSQPTEKRFTDELKRRGFFKELLRVFLKNNITTIRINLQSKDTRKAVERLIDKKILINPREEVGVSVDQHPSVFDINIDF